MSWSTERLTAALHLNGLRVVATHGKLLQARGKHYESNFMDTYIFGCSSNYITIQLVTGMGYALSANLTETEIVDAVATIQMPCSPNAQLKSREEIKRAGFVEAWEISEARNSTTNALLRSSFSNDDNETTVHFRESCIIAFRANTNDLEPYCMILAPSSLEAAKQTYLEYIGTQS